MKYIVFLTLLCACGSRPYYELDALAKDAIKSKSNIQIDIKSAPRP